MVLRRLSNTLLSVCWCPENGTSLHTRGFGKILHNSLSPGFYFLSSLSFLPSFFSQLFPSSPYPVSFVSFFFYPFPHSLCLSRCKFYSPSLSSFLPLPPSFLPPCNVSPFFLTPSLLASTFACFIPHALSSCILNLCSFVRLFQHSPSSFLSCYNSENNDDDDDDNYYYYHTELLSFTPLVSVFKQPSTYCF